MKQVSDVLNEKGRHVWSLTPEATVYEAIDQMAQKEVGALLVMEGERLVGIVSERDYTRKVILKGKASPGDPGSRDHVPSGHLRRPEFTVEQTMVLMTEKRIRHLPVVVEERVVGVISIGDVVRAIIDDKEFDIQQLRNYIIGG